MTDLCKKRPYATEKSARRKLREVKRSRGRHHQHGEKCERRVYRCEVCRRYHLTSAPYDPPDDD